MLLRRLLSCLPELAGGATAVAAAAALAASSSSPSPAPGACAAEIEKAARHRAVEYKNQLSPSSLGLRPEAVARLLVTAAQSTWKAGRADTEGRGRPSPAGKAPTLGLGSFIQAVSAVCSKVGLVRQSF